MSAEIHLGLAELHAATISVLADAHRFVVEAVLDRVHVDGFDPNDHVMAVRLRAAVDALGGDPRALVDARRGVAGIDPAEATDLYDECDDDWWEE